MTRKITTPKAGDKVRITASQLGCMTAPDDGRFSNETLNHGDQATFVGPHPRAELADKGWDLVKVERDGVTLWCPLHDTHYEKWSEHSVGTQLFIATTKELERRKNG